jgi:hypothetical protein
MRLTENLMADVLVIGAGGAGLRAALAAAEAGARVILANKGPLAKSGITLTAAGGMQAPLHPTDSAELYYEDIVRCGYGLADGDLARTLAAEAAVRVPEIERYGARLGRDADGGYALRQFPGQSRPRNLFVKGGGIGLAAALAGACRRHGGITILEDFFVTGLVTGDSGAAAGAVGSRSQERDADAAGGRGDGDGDRGCQWLWATNDCPPGDGGRNRVRVPRRPRNWWTWRWCCFISVGGGVAAVAPGIVRALRVPGRERAGRECVRQRRSAGAAEAAAGTGRGDADAGAGDPRGPGRAAWRAVLVCGRFAAGSGGGGPEARYAAV